MGGWSVVGGMVCCRGCMGGWSVVGGAWGDGLL